MNLLTRRSVFAMAAAGTAALALALADGRPASSNTALAPDSNPPILAGDVFYYKSKSTDKYAATGQNPVITITSNTSRSTATGGASFNGHSNLIELTNQFSDDPMVFEEFVGFVAGGGAKEELLYGDTGTYEADGIAQTLSITIPGGEILDIYPEAAGQTWSAAATSASATTLTELLAAE